MLVVRIDISRAKIDENIDYEHDVNDKVEYGENVFLRTCEQFYIVVLLVAERRLVE